METSLQRCRFLPASIDAVIDLAVSSDRRHLVVSRSTGFIETYSVTQDLVRVNLIDSSVGAPSCVATASSALAGDLIVSGSRDGFLRAHAVSSPALIASTQSYGGSIYALDVSTEGIAAVACSDNVVRFFSISPSGELSLATNVVIGEEISSVVFSKQYNALDKSYTPLLAVGTSAGSIHLFDASTLTSESASRPAALGRLQAIGSRRKEATVTSLAFLDGFLASSGIDGTVTVWRLSTGEVHGTLALSDSALLTLVPGPLGVTFFASGVDPAVVRVAYEASLDRWVPCERHTASSGDVTTGVAASFPLLSGSALMGRRARSGDESAVVCPLLITGGADGSLSVFRLAEFSDRRPFTRVASVNTQSFSVSGSYVANLSSGVAEFWKVPTAAEGDSGAEPQCLVRLRSSKFEAATCLHLTETLHMAIGCARSTRLYRLDTESPGATRLSLSVRGTASAICSCGDLLAVGTTNGDVSVFRLGPASADLLSTFSDLGVIRSLTLDDGEHLAVVSDRVTVISLDAGAPISAQPPLYAPRAVVSALFLPGSVLMVALSDNSVRFHGCLGECTFALSQSVGFPEWLRQRTPDHVYFMTLLKDVIIMGGRGFLCGACLDRDASINNFRRVRHLEHLRGIGVLADGSVAVGETTTAQLAGELPPVAFVRKYARG